MVEWTKAGKYPSKMVWGTDDLETSTHHKPERGQSSFMGLRASLEHGKLVLESVFESVPLDGGPSFLEGRIASILTPDEMCQLATRLVQTATEARELLGKDASTYRSSKGGTAGDVTEGMVFDAGQE